MEKLYKYKDNNNEILLNENGYIACNDYIQYTHNFNIYMGEIEIINKIIANEEGFFDFSKSMIDIGCEYGTYSFMLNFKEQHMFDGNKYKLTLAQMNMLLHNKLETSKIYHTLLSDKSEFIDYDGFLTNYSLNGDFYDKPIKKEATTLDTFHLNNIGFIKIDVENMEEKVLRGGIYTIISNNYPPILFEAWNIEDVRASLHNFLTNLGYEILWSWGDSDTHLAIHK